MWLFVGLGNPGQRYAGTRHNVGFQVLEHLSSSWKIPVDRSSFEARVGVGLVRAERVVLAMPQLFMNRSGYPAECARNWHKVPLENVVVLHDDLDLPFGQVRVKSGGGDGGHNGLRDLAAHMGSGFVRIRFGISRPPEGWDSANYVLSQWYSEEAPKLGDLLEKGREAAELILSEGALAAMNRMNARPRSPAKSPEESKGESPQRTQNLNFQQQVAGLPARPPRGETEDSR